MPIRLRTMAAVTLVLAAVSVAAPSASASARASGPSYEYRGHHGLNRSDMRMFVSLWKARRMEPVSFSVGLQGAQDRYAMFWDNRRGPHRILRTTLTAARYQELVDASSVGSYQPVMVSATGSGQDTTFNAILEYKAGRFLARHGITIPEFLSANTDASRSGYILTSVNLYGTASDQRVAAVWTAKPSGVDWHFTLSDSASEYQRVFDTYVKRGYRPSAIAVTPDGKGYLTVWRNDRIGTWYAFHGMSAAQYQARYDEMTAKGLYPTWIDMENGVYAAIFTAR
ncbi:hypothetical protein [Microtetraspora niveoalba]|uniref:hypothetical protein n=1 Tax=Microtetraspora niveoalba TaxID=46175 RepID=UPI000A477D3A|nr:hypothetical protein [Microtetraspora niveoalba]